MSEQMRFEYYYGEEAEQFNFLMLPKFLLKEPRFAQLSDTSKILYSLMLERMSLSRKKGWFDDQNRPFIYYGVDYAKQETGHSKPTVIKAMKEIEEIGLIERKKQGQGRPTIVYVKKYVSEKNLLTSGTKPEVKNLDFKKSTPLTSRSKELELQEVNDADFKRSGTLTSRSQDVGLQEVKGIDPNYTESIYTESDHTEQSNTESGYNSPVLSEEGGNELLGCQDWSKPITVTSAGSSRAKHNRLTDRNRFIATLRKQIEYDMLREDSRYWNMMEIVDGIVNIIADIVTIDSPDGYERVNGREYPQEVVRNKLMRMDHATITHVLDRFRENTTKIRNMRSYLVTALYNAGDEMDIHTQCEVNHDLYNWGMQEDWEE